MKPRMIAISGKSGCGNTTVSDRLAKRLEFELVNYTFRALAVDMGISLEEVLKLAEDDYSFDRKVDAHQVALARQKDSVIGSRLAIWMLPDASLRVYLAAAPEVRALRIHGREGGDFSDKLAFTIERDRRDHERYRAIYGINNNDISFCDLIIDTERFEPNAIVDIIVSAFLGRKR